VDFLREFDICTVKGFIDRQSATPMSLKQKQGYEVRIFQYTGGILDMEKKLEKGLFDGDILLNFLALCERFYACDGGIYNDEFIRLVWEFIDCLAYKRLVNYKEWVRYKNVSKYFVDDQGQFTPTNLFAPYPVFPQEMGYVFTVKRGLDIDYFRQQASVFLFKFIKTIESKECLVLDQFIAQGVSNETVKAYFHDFNVKRVHVFREPRDVFATSILLDVKYIPHDHPNRFIEWYKSKRKSYPIGANNGVLYMKFEDLVLNYQESTEKIMRFLDLKEENHIHKKCFFDPEISKKNIGLYKQLDGQTLDLFERELGEWFYKQ
jgi:hypothetical protein